MNNELGFENRKAYLERARDGRMLNVQHQEPLNMNLGKSRVAREMSRYHKQARFDNNAHMNVMHKENFNRNFNKNI